MHKNYGNTIDQRWIDVFGSKQLKLSVSQNYDCWELYLNERIDQDFPGFSIHYKDKVNPVTAIPVCYLEIAELYSNEFKIGADYTYNNNYYYYLYASVEYNEKPMYISKDITLNNIQLFFIWLKTICHF